jgi:hypothetical protein
VNNARRLFLGKVCVDKYRQFVREELDNVSCYALMIVMYLHSAISRVRV